MDWQCFVETSSLAYVISETCMVILAPIPLTPTAALLDKHRGWNTANKSDVVPLVLFFAEVGSSRFASSSGSDGELCGFYVYPCSSLSTLQIRLAANGSKTEGKLNPITIELQTALDHSTPFSCGGHKAAITGNTITFSKTGQFTTFSIDSVITLSSLTILFASSQTQPAISISTGSIVVSDCTIGKGHALRMKHSEHIRRYLSHPCSSLSTVQTPLEQSWPFSCGGHKATIAGNTIIHELYEIEEM
ncbi:hypothetical protein BLNAU_17422 [Blattamonas nauphoetae]|uniref:Uncharacterized protein n=1 Tax=Blattamonas nauphoetae TaxID=2049346 RepID=A0ABQ9X908_9EUKA|nr:hypothetical protein BLNAU_17422 [Blattamonas nauphoetae]